MDSHYGFRLQELNHNTDVSSTKDGEDTSVSGYSVYKQRIDALFDDSKSQISDVSQTKHYKRPSKSLMDGKYSSNQIEIDRSVSNNVQERIEKMFEEISIHGFKKSNSFKNVSKHQKPNDFYSEKYQNSKFNNFVKQKQEQTIPRHFLVDYLGSVTLPDKVVSLLGLQEPLRDLYIQYKRRHITNRWSNKLEISREGLKIGKQGEMPLGALNPFPTIAVWAAVKFVCRRNERNQIEHGFLPLIADPEGIDKNTLFSVIKVDDQKFLKGKEDEETPLFTVVMRKTGIAKQLECHAFICVSSEEAIVIAANLYQALMKNMQRKKEKRKMDKTCENRGMNQSYENYDKEEKTNDSLDRISEQPKNEVHKKIPPPVPSRPPRKTKKSSSSSLSSEGEDLIFELEQVFKEVRKQNAEKEANFILDKPKSPELFAKKRESSEIKAKNNGCRLKRRGSEPANVFSIDPAPVTSLRRSVSERRNSGITSKDSSECGDILTKVAIPRSRSFLNANGPLTRYSRKSKSGSIKANGGSGSPLGFNELFNEFRLHEGLESMDDILNAIIDAEGMSFNDLKPIYKEFLLKLAVTLTKDELYQRSKSIMRRQRKKKIRNSGLNKKTFIAATGLRKVFRKTASKLKTKSTRPSSFEFTSVVFQSSAKRFETSTTSTSSCGTRLKPGQRLQRRQSQRKRNGQYHKKSKNKKLSSTSDDSDFFTQKRLMRMKNDNCHNRSSSGYVTCSECSYDSESCTCVSADKCYCTLGQKKKKVETKKSTGTATLKTNSEKDKSNSSLQLSGRDVFEQDKESVSSCVCDTDSCVDSEKCYCSGKSNALKDMSGVCQTPHLHQLNSFQHSKNCPNATKVDCKRHGQTIFDQLKEQGFAASESSLSRAASPSTAWRNNEEIISRRGRTKDGLQPSRSLEFLQMRPRSESRQQIHECPPPPKTTDATPFRRNGVRASARLNELQRKSSARENFVEGTRHRCYHGTLADRQSIRYRREYLSQMERNVFSSQRTRPSPRRQHVYHSMRSRNCDYVTDAPRIRRFGSLRTKPTTDNIFDKVLFPDASRNNSLRFPRRMDVYNSTRLSRSCSNPVIHSQFEQAVQTLNLLNQIQNCRIHGTSTVQSSACRQPRSRPVVCNRPRKDNDNFQKLDYELFTTSCKSDTSDTISNKMPPERKVLVVSARDPKGKVLYMGASCRGEKMNKNSSSTSNKYLESNTTDACEALSVKKSAEIAALFSDVCNKTKTSRSNSYKDDLFYTKDFSSRPRSYNTTNMENSLGYLP